jgi:hypothetical protein
VLLAAGSGALFGLLQQRRALKRAAQALTPADASTVEAIPLPARTEQALRERAELYLAELDQKKMPENVAAGLGLFLDLGLLYLEEHRLDDADKLFSRLDRESNPRPYYFLGHLGRGIVLALRNKERQSNKLFADVFQGSAQPPKEDGAVLDQFMLNRKWRYWLTRARWYNQENGVEEKDVPRTLRNLVSLNTDRPTPAPAGE